MTGRTVLTLVPGLAVAIAVVIVGGCSVDGTDRGFVTVPDTGPADQLAPSQLSSPTAPPPDVPPPCDPGDLAIWTAQVLVADTTAEAVIRLRNDGVDECEVDLSASSLRSPTMEPDVWLEPGAWADLIVGASEAECSEAPAVISTVLLDVNGTAVAVDTAVAVGCEPELVAFYPNELGDEPCAELAAAAIPGAIVLRNDGLGTCRLGSLVSATGLDGLDVGVVGFDPPDAVPVLAAGDVVAFEVVEAADGADRQVELGFDSGVVVDVQLPRESSVRVVGGPPRPWFGGPGSPVASGDLFAALDPF